MHNAHNSIRNFTTLFENIGNEAEQQTRMCWIWYLHIISCFCAPSQLLRKNDEMRLVYTGPKSWAYERILCLFFYQLTASILVRQYAKRTKFLFKINYKYTHDFKPNVDQALRPSLHCAYKSFYAQRKSVEDVYTLVM